MLDLSPAQRSLWVLHQLDDTGFTLSSAHRLRGPFDLGAFTAAVDAVVARHSPLRTRFPVGADGGPDPVVDPPGPVVVEAVAAEGFTAAHAEAARFCARPFDLAREWPLRVLVVRLSTEDHVVALAVHHISCDGVSLGLLHDELSQLYGGAELPPVADHRELVARRAVDPAAVARCRDRLAGVPPLAADRPPVRSGKGDQVWFTVPADLTEAVRACARRHRVTAFMVLLAAFQLVLHRRTGQVDFAVGVPVAGRGDPDSANVIGLFTNTVVVRADLAGEPAAAEVLRRVREAAFDAFADQDVPLDAVVAAVGEPPDPARTPLFQALFTFQDAPVGRLALPGVRCVELDLPTGAAASDLELELVRDGDELAGSLEYSTDLHDSGTAAALTADFLAVLDEITAE